MTLKNKKLLYIFLYLLSFGQVIGTLILINKIEFIPMINNVILGLSYLVFFGLQIFSIYKILNFKFNRYLKVLVGLILIGLCLISMACILMVFAFAGKDNRQVTYDDEKFYILDVGWLDPAYEVYRKNFITMDKLSEDEIKDTFADLIKIEDEDIREILKTLIYGREGLDDSKAEEENKNQDLEEAKENEGVVKENKEEVLKNFEVSDAIKIENSDYGLLEVDRAGARSRWFLVKISGDDMEFISELGDTSPEASGRMDEDGTIHLDFKDINNNKTTYISKDKGRTFEKIK
ncbi:hypothetical protein [Peptoniphilus sp. DNF00840]|uniref:hypothetical protein n=1 Tax=Peptoniphilus sp. DNF00840 TaxID=1477000 RepID=UPI0007818404|nr:hypothetical protein [Peptoniphilus sp. DNF00840]KXB69899.1 hypothetical protein HMPREF1864_01262 [Peptoniphilus sp. DNF00840]